MLVAVAGAVAAALQDLTWQIALYAVLSLTVIRMAPVAVALAGARLGHAAVVLPERRLIRRVPAAAPATVADPTRLDGGQPVPGSGRYAPDLRWAAGGPGFGRGGAIGADVIRPG